MPNQSNRPGSAHKARPGLLQVPGDVRLLQPGQKAQLIDIEYDMPGSYLVTCISGQLIDWRINTGIDRAQLAEHIPPTPIDTFAVVVIARSIQVFANNTSGVAAQAFGVITPIDLTYPAADIVGSVLGTGLGISPTAAHTIAITQGIATNVASVELVPIGFSAAAIFNTSPAGRNLFVRFGTAAATTASGGYGVRIPPNGYFEVPFGSLAYSGPIQGIWDGADAAGFANVTLIP